MRIMIRQLAPGMVQQMQSVCTDCNGEGENSFISIRARPIYSFADFNARFEPVADISVLANMPPI